jgi:hypothetical protein
MVVPPLSCAARGAGEPVAGIVNDRRNNQRTAIARGAWQIGRE